MSKTAETLKMAYEAFEKRIKENEPHLNLKSDKEGFIDNTVEQKFWDFLAGWNACKEALNQEQEPVGYTSQGHIDGVKNSFGDLGNFAGNFFINKWKTVNIPLYTHPAPSQEPLSKTAERDYNFMRDLAIGTEKELNKTLQELNELKELLAQRNLELLEARQKLTEQAHGIGVKDGN